MAGGCNAFNVLHMNMHLQDWSQDGTKSMLIASLMAVNCWNCWNSWHSCLFPVHDQSMCSLMEWHHLNATMQDHLTSISEYSTSFLSHNLHWSKTWAVTGLLKGWPLRGKVMIKMTRMKLLSGQVKNYEGLAGVLTWNLLCIYSPRFDNNLSKVR